MNSKIKHFKLSQGIHICRTMVVPDFKNLNKFGNHFKSFLFKKLKKKSKFLKLKVKILKINSKIF